MVLYKRKQLPLNKPPTVQSENQDVWFLKQSGEIFTSYDSYLERYDFLNKKRFICEATGHSCLSFSEALQSEAYQAKEIAHIFPNALKEPVLRQIQFSTISRLDHLIDLVYDSCKKDFYPGEYVIATIDSEKFNVLIREKAKFSSIRLPNGEIRPSFSRYRVEYVNTPGKEGSLDENQLSRDRKTFTKAILKSFIKNSVTKESWAGAPWVVKPQYAQQYRIQTNVHGNLDLSQSHQSLSAILSDDQDHQPYTSINSIIDPYTNNQNSEILQDNQKLKLKAKTKNKEKDKDKDKLKGKDKENEKKIKNKDKEKEKNKNKSKTKEKEKEKEKEKNEDEIVNDHKNYSENENDCDDKLKNGKNKAKNKKTKDSLPDEKNKKPKKKDSIKDKKLSNEEDQEKKRLAKEEKQKQKQQERLLIKQEAARKKQEAAAAAASEKQAKEAKEAREAELKAKRKKLMEEILLPYDVKKPSEDSERFPNDMEQLIARPSLKFLDEGVDGDLIPLVIETWSFLNFFRIPLNLSTFTFDDYLQALRATPSNADFSCVMIREINCALLNSMVSSKSSEVLITLPLDPDERKRIFKPRINSRYSLVQNENQSQDKDPNLENFSSKESTFHNCNDTNIDEKSDSMKKKNEINDRNNGTENPFSHEDDSSASSDIDDNNADELEKRMGNWIDRISKRLFKNGGWETTIAIFLNEISYSVEYKDKSIPIVNKLIPLNLPITSETVKNAYFSLCLRDKLTIIEILISFVAPSQLTRNYIEECMNNSTEVRRNRLQLIRDERNLLNEIDVLNLKRQKFIETELNNTGQNGMVSSISSSSSFTLPLVKSELSLTDNMKSEDNIESDIENNIENDFENNIEKNIGNNTENEDSNQIKLEHDMNNNGVMSNISSTSINNKNNNYNIKNSEKNDLLIKSEDHKSDKDTQNSHNEEDNIEGEGDYLLDGEMIEHPRDDIFNEENPVIEEIEKSLIIKNKEFSNIKQQIDKVKKKLEKMKEETLLCDERLRELDCQRVRLLGRDRFFNRYWWFEGNGINFGSECSYQYCMGRLWIQGPSDEDKMILKNNYARIPIKYGRWSEAPMNLYIKDEDNTDFNVPVLMRKKLEEGNTSLNSIREWGYYDNPHQINRLFKWLYPMGIRESKLRKELETHYDNIVQSMEARRKYLRHDEFQEANEDFNILRNGFKNDISKDITKNGKNSLLSIENKENVLSSNLNSNLKRGHSLVGIDSNLSSYLSDDNGNENENGIGHGHVHGHENNEINDNDEDNDDSYNYIEENEEPVKRGRGRPRKRARKESFISLPETKIETKNLPKCYKWTNFEALNNFGHLLSEFPKRGLIKRAKDTRKTRGRKFSK